MIIEKREAIKYILLSIVTCGIFGLIWAYKMGKECAQVKDPNDAGTLESLLMMFVSPIGFFLAEKKLAEGCQMRGIEHKDNSILYIILGFVGLGIVNFYLMQTDLNNIADIVNGQSYQA